MRHWPITEALVVVFLGLVLLLPLLHVTGKETVRVGSERTLSIGAGGDSSAGQVADDDSAEPMRCWLTVRSAHPLEQLRVSCEGVELLSRTQMLSRVERSVDLPLGRTGLELLVEARWPQGTPESVVEILVEPDTLDSRRQSAWGQGELDDILSFQWPPSTGIR